MLKLSEVKRMESGIECSNCLKLRDWNQEWETKRSESGIEHDIRNRKLRDWNQGSSIETKRLESGIEH